MCLPSRGYPKPRHAVVRRGAVGRPHRSQRTPRVLGHCVPSAVLPIAMNDLINPFPPDVHELERWEPVPFAWDARRFQRPRGKDDE